MADEEQGVPAPNPHPHHVSPADPAVPQALQDPQQPMPQMVNLNWSYFKPEFLGRPDEDAEA